MSRTRSAARAASWWRARTAVTLRHRNVHLAASVQLDPHAIIRVGRADGEHVTVAEGCQIHHGAMLATYGGWIEIGPGSSVNPYAVVYGHGGTRIGQGVRIATHVVIVPANHVFADPGMPISRQGETREGIEIEDDVWIGANATILDGCRVGRGSVVAAGAVVSRDVPPLAVVAGCPARVIRTRGAADV